MLEIEYTQWFNKCGGGTNLRIIATTGCLHPISFVDDKCLGYELHHYLCIYKNLMEDGKIILINKDVTERAIIYTFKLLV